MQYTRRLLGLDGLDPQTGRSRFKARARRSANSLASLAELRK